MSWFFPCCFGSWALGVHHLLDWPFAERLVFSLLCFVLPLLLLLTPLFPPQLCSPPYSKALTPADGLLCSRLPFPPPFTVRGHRPLKHLQLRFAVNSFAALAHLGCILGGVWAISFFVCLGLPLSIALVVFQLQLRLAVIYTHCHCLPPEHIEWLLRFTWSSSFFLSFTSLVDLWWITSRTPVLVSTPPRVFGSCFLCPLLRCHSFPPSQGHGTLLLCCFALVDQFTYLSPSEDITHSGIRSCGSP